MDEQRWEKLADVFFGEGSHHSAEAQALAILAQKDLTLEQRQTVLAICRQPTMEEKGRTSKLGDYLKIGRIIQATLVSDNEHADIWLGLFRKALAEKELEEKFYLGLALGLYQALPKLDQTRIITSVCELTAEIISWQGDFPGYYMPSWVPCEGYSSELSKAIKTYYRDEDRQIRQGRFKQFREVVNIICEKHRTLQKPGELILEQISFAISSLIPVMPRALHLAMFGSKVN